VLDRVTLPPKVDAAVVTVFVTIGPAAPCKTYACWCVFQRARTSQFRAWYLVWNVKGGVSVWRRSHRGGHWFESSRVHQHSRRAPLLMAAIVRFCPFASQTAPRQQIRYPFEGQRFGGYDSSPDVQDFRLSKMH
jgi:hypothetical protein